MSESVEVPGPSKPGKNKKLVIGIGAVVALVVIVVLVVVLTRGNSNNSGSNPMLETTPTSFSTVTDREYALIAKDPKAHVGECVKVFGKVTQADEKTGNSHIRANTEASKQAQTYDYNINTLLSSSGTVLSDFVANDQFSADACVIGQFTYKNTLGAESQALQLQVFAITRDTAAK